MKYLRDVIARKRPRPASAEQRDTEDSDQVSDFFDLDAVRARLQEPDETEEPWLEKAVDPPEEMTAAPARAADRPALKKHIWDIEDGVPDEDAARSRHKPDRLAIGSEPAGERSVTRGRIGLERDTAKAPAVSAATRAKTRIIGFHAGGIETDVFSAERAAPAARGQFPVGWLVVIDGPGRGASFTIGAGVSTIGRSADQTVSLDFGDTSVSRENHASVAYDEEQNRFFIGHGGKSNIVRRNGNPVLATEDLADADLIRIGKTTLRFVALCGSDFTWGSTDDEQETDAPDA